MLDPQRPDPGTTHRTLLTLPFEPGVELPCITVRGARDGPTLVVSAGVHGSEFASIEAAYRVAGTDPATLHGTLRVLPVVCPPAFFARSIYANPVDGTNLNRQFPGDPEGTFAQKLAHWLTTEVLARADAYVDLHGGDLIEPLHPFTLFAAEDEQARAMAEAFGIETLVASESTGMTVAAAASHGVPAILPEASGQGLRPEAEVGRLARGVERTLVHLGMREGALEPVETTLLTEFSWLRAEHHGLWYPAVSAGAHVEAGQAVGVVRSLLGVPLQEALAPVSGRVLFGVSSLSISPGEPLVGIGA